LRKIADKHIWVAGPRPHPVAAHSLAAKQMSGRQDDRTSGRQDDGGRQI